MNRRLFAALALVGLVGLTGCTTFIGGGADDPEALSADGEYDFDTDSDAFITVNENNYTAVYNVSAKAAGDEGTIELWQTNALTIENPLEVSALQFRYLNGTVVRFIDGDAMVIREDGTREPTDALAVNTTRQRTVIHLPAEEGQLAFTVEKTGKEIMLRPPVHGSYEIALPPETDTSIPLLSRVRPPNDDREVVGDRVHLQWEEVETSILTVRWYLDRDLWLFGGLASIAGVVGVVGAVFYYRQITRARRRRDQEGIDIDHEDDDQDGPPPGLR
jgi:hypothetical protein